jgi:hypothetical protein
MGSRRDAHGVNARKTLRGNSGLAVWFGPAGGGSFDPEEDHLAGCLNWRAVRAGQQLATAGAQNHDPDTRPFTWRTCFPCQVLTKGLLTSVSGVRTAQYVAEHKLYTGKLTFTWLQCCLAVSEDFSASPV